MNRAVTALYEPGSTFKPHHPGGRVRSGKLRGRTKYSIARERGRICGRASHRDHKPFGLLNVEDILAQSSDVGATRLRCGLERRNFYDYIRAFGFWAADRRGHARRKQGHSAATGELVGGLDWVDLNGAGSRGHADSAHHRSIRDCQRPDCFTSRMSLPN